MKTDRICSILAGLTFATALMTSVPARAQITALGASTLVPSGVLASFDYDDKHHVYLHAWEYQNRVWGRFVGADGAVLGVSFIVSTAVAPNGFAGRPKVAYTRGSSADEFLVMYASDVNAVNTASNIFGQIIRYTGQGSTAGTMDPGFITLSPFFANSTLLQVLDAVVFNPTTGRFLVVWEEAPSGYEVVCRHVALDGSPVGSTWNISEAPGSQGISQAAFDPTNNRYLVAYVGDGGLPGFPTLGTFVRVLDGNTAQPTSSIVVLGAGYGTEPSVTYLPALDGFLVTWTIFKPDRAVIARFVPSTSPGTLSDAYLALDTLGNDGGASITYDAASRWVVVAAMSDPKYIRGALLNATGVPQTAPFVLGTSPAVSGSYYPTVRPAEGGIVGLIYVTDYTFAVLERFQLDGASSPVPPPPTKPKAPNPHDLDGDGRSDLVVWRPSTGTWFSLTSSTGYNSAGGKQWGNQSFGDVPFMGDVDGDRIADLIVWRASTGTWYWVTSSTGYNDNAFGGKQWGSQSLGDVPMLGDIDGDGKVDLIVWRASTGTWYWLTSSTGYSYASQGQKQWGSGSEGDVPKTGDIDGDGKADLIVWRPSSGMWFWLTSSSGYNYASSGMKQWGSQVAGDVPLVGDIDGDGKTDLIVWRGPTGTWFWLTSSSGFDTAAQGQKQWGNLAAQDVPQLSDFDGDRRADLVVWRASTGTWYWLTSTSGYAYSAARGQQWGSALMGDIPMLR